MQPDITRRQLWGLGLSKYQAAALTQSVQPIKKQGNAFVYGLPEIIAAAREYLSRRIQPQTRPIIEALIFQLQAMLGNVMPMTSGSTDPEIRKAAIALTRAIAHTDAGMAQLNARKTRIHREQAPCP